jgi:hypothetical protein
MAAPHKERKSLLIYTLVFFACLAISAFTLLVQLQNSNRNAAEFFEPIQIDLANPLF